MCVHLCIYMYPSVCTYKCAYNRYEVVINNKKIKQKQTRVYMYVYMYTFVYSIHMYVHVYMIGCMDAWR